MGFRNEGFPERDPGWKGTRISVRQQAAASTCLRVYCQRASTRPRRCYQAAAMLPGRGDATRPRRCYLPRQVYLKVDGTESVVS